MTVARPAVRAVRLRRPPWSRTARRRSGDGDGEGGLRVRHRRARRDADRPQRALALHRQDHPQAVATVTTGRDVRSGEVLPAVRRLRLDPDRLVDGRRTVDREEPVDAELLATVDVALRRVRGDVRARRLRCDRRTSDNTTGENAAGDHRASAAQQESARGHVAHLFLPRMVVAGWTIHLTAGAAITARQPPATPTIRVQ